MMDSPPILKRSINDYFTPKTSTATRENAQNSTVSPTHALDASHERPQKKFKITADNGRDFALRGLQEKRVKREGIEGSLGTSNSATSTRRTAGRAKLGLLPSVPLDVLLEVFSHLAPLDILRLSRTTKDLRKLLLHRSSSYVWRTALTSVEGLPECPEEVSLPFWTNLVFDHHCHNCLTNNVKKCNFALRVRYCKKCAGIKLLRLSDFDQNIKLHQILLKCLPFSRWNDGNEKFCTVAEKLRLLGELEVVLANKNSSVISEFIAQRRKEIKARLVYAQTCKKWMSSIIRGRERELKDTRKSRADAIRAELVKLGYEPELQFLDNLKAGICATVSWPNIDMFDKHELVKPAKLLTEKSWAAMKDEMLQYMAKASQLRQESIHSTVISQRRSLIHTAYINWRTKPENLVKYPADSPMPSPGDVLEFSPLKCLIDMKTELELDMDLHIMPCLARSLPSEISSWREDLARTLWHKVVDSRSAWIDEAEWYIFGQDWRQHLRFLERAIVVFRCKGMIHWCWEEKRIRADVVFPANTPNLEYAITKAAYEDAHAPVMWYPQFVHHKCASMIYRPYGERRAGMNDSLCMKKEYAHCRHALWDADTLEFDERASRATRNILEACGMNWKTATTKELDKRDPRLVCLKCSFGVRCDGDRRVRVWTWRDAVQHCLSAHFGDAQVTWECLSPEDTANARLLDIFECVHRGFHSSGNQKVWRCIKCRDTIADTGRMRWDELAEHFRQNTTHGDANDMEDKEDALYYRDLDVCPREGPPVKMIPSKTDPPAPGNSSRPTSEPDKAPYNTSFIEWLLRLPESP